MEYSNSLGGERAQLGFFGPLTPDSSDGSPRVRLSFIKLPANCVVSGPEGEKRLKTPGIYEVCYLHHALTDMHVMDFILATNEKQGLRDSTTRKSKRSAKSKKVVASDTNDEDVIKYKDPALFLNSDAPVGPSILSDHDHADLTNLFNGHTGFIIQFRLPQFYSIRGPQGNIMTFDRKHYEEPDRAGNPLGVGGTYCIFVQPLDGENVILALQQLPVHAAFRIVSEESLVVIRKGNVLPRFLGPGVVQECGVRGGTLDFYNAQGRYNIPHAKGSQNLLPEILYAQDSQNPLPDTPEAQDSQNLLPDIPASNGKKTTRPAYKGKKVLTEEEMIKREKALEKRRPRDRLRYQEKKRQRLAEKAMKEVEAQKKAEEEAEALKKAEEVAAAVEEAEGEEEEEVLEQAEKMLVDEEENEG